MSIGKLVSDQTIKVVTKSSARKTDHKTKKSESMFLSVLAAGSQLGFTISFPIAGGVLLGVYIDKKTGHAPLFTILLLLLGVIVSFNIIYRILKDFNE